MAIMIPEKPNDFDPASQEDLMFEALKKLSNDYFVFHSLRITKIKSKTLHESETDFVIVNRKKGLLCLEAKAGKIKYEEGEWRYSNGVRMRHGGPFNQAQSNKYKTMDLINDRLGPSVLECLPFFHAVWFPSVTINDLNSLFLPPEADKQLILTKEALSNPTDYIDSIFSIELTNGISANLSETQFNRLITHVLCPSFNVFPTASFQTDANNLVFHRLLNEQAGILNFLTDQKTAAINGAAGTGKTMIAIEKGRRHAVEGEKVLFLCFNSRLKRYLEEKYPYDNISFYTIAGYACKLANSPIPDYVKARQKLENQWISNSFPYKHILIDEGQDFGNETIEEANILDSLYEIVTSENVDGSFYIFYDKLQMVQSAQIPVLIEKLDCKLSLTRNCRNTENIARTSMKPMPENQPKFFDGTVKGTPVQLHFCDEKEEVRRQVDTLLENYEKEGITDVVILTCKTKLTSVFDEYIIDDKYKNKWVFATCRQFKGLEADAVILVDVDETTFCDSPLLFYVGASRARLHLDIILEISDRGCEKVIKEVFGEQKIKKKPKKQLTGLLNAI